MLVNGVVTNSEVWYDLSKSDVAELSKIDKLFFQMLTKSAKSTPTESWFLEFKVLSIPTIMKGQRLNYLHYLASRPSSMLADFFRLQWVCPHPKDWTITIREDLKDLNISD